MDHAPGRMLLMLVLCLASSWLWARETGGEQWFLASVDHYETGYYVLLVDFPEAGLAVRRLDLAVLGIGLPEGEDLRYAAESYNRVANLERYRVVVDRVSRRVHFVRRRQRDVGTPQSRDLLLTAQVNRRRIDRPSLVHFRDGEFWLPPESLANLGVDAAAVEHAGEGPGIPMHAVAGEKFSVDPKTLELVMTVPPERLRTTVVGDKHAARGLRPDPSWSSILDYRLTGGRGADGRDWSSAEAGLSVSSGTTLCRTEHLYRSREERVDRLESLCRLDMPEKLISVALGDQIADPGVLGEPLRYGGLRIGTDFELAPEFVTQPTLSLSGTARVPSMLEVWTDRMLNLSREIPPGPFEITEIPAQTGAGELRAVVDDGSGVPTVITRPFYSDPSLLAEDLVEWSLEGGKRREGLLTEDDRYEEPFAVFNARLGVKDWLTLAGRAEYQQQASMAALSGSLRLGQLGVLQLGGAGSRTGQGITGQAALLGFSRRGRHLSLGYDETLTDDGFAQLGYETPGSAPERDRRLTLGLDIGGGVSLTLSRVRRDFREQENQRFNSASLNLPFFHRGSLQLSVFDVRAPQENRFYGLQLTLPLGSRENISLSAEGEELENRLLTAQRNLPAGPGVGYRFSGGEIGEQESASGDLFWRNQQALMRLHGRRLGEAESGFAEVSGSVIGADGLHLAPESPGSYALAEVGEPGVRIYRDNRLAGVTDENGRLLVPGLRPYESNRLSLAPEDLSLTTQAGSTEVTVKPGRRQVLEAAFDTRSGRYLNARLVRAEGSPVPAGAVVRLRDGSETVIGRNGLLYLRLPADEEISARVSWREGNCRFRWTPAGTAADLIEGGTLTCH